jgi:hypothetical protein
VAVVRIAVKFHKAQALHVLLSDRDFETITR